LSALGLKPDDRILFPETICDVTLSALHLRKLRPQYYRLNDDFTPDWLALEKQLTSDVRALMLVHYFGVPQDLDQATAFCRKHNILLIEDNAHGYGAEYRGSPLGTWGDIGIASPRKNNGYVNNGAVLFVNPEAADTHSIELGLPLEPIPYLQVFNGTIKAMFSAFHITIKYRGPNRTGTL